MRRKREDGSRPADSSSTASSLAPPPPPPPPPSEKVGCATCRGDAPPPPTVERTVTLVHGTWAEHAPWTHDGEALVDWRKSAPRLGREVRAFNPWPVSHTRLDGNSLRLWSASVADMPGEKLPGQVLRHDRQGIFVACGEGVLQITELQFAGRKRCSAAEALNARNLDGCRFGAD